MRRFALVLLAVMLSGVCMAQPSGNPSPFMNSGFQLGAESSTGVIFGSMAYGPRLLRVTKVTSTTVFYCEIANLAIGLGSGSQNVSPFTNWTIRGVSCTTAGNVGLSQTISASVSSTGKFTTTAWPTALAVGDWVALVPPGTGYDESYGVVVQPTTFATASTWDEVAFNRILTVSGACRIRIICTIDLAFTGGAAGRSIALGTTTGPTNFINATLYSNFGTAKQFWYTNAATVTNGAPSNLILDKIVYGVVATEDVGYTIAGAAPTAGTFSFYCWITPLVSGAYAIPGSGEAN